MKELIKYYRELIKQYDINNLILVETEMSKEIIERIREELIKFDNILETYKDKNKLKEMLEERRIYNEW